MKSRISASIFTALLAFTNPAFADETVAIKVGYMLLSPSGTFGATINNIGTKIDTKNDINLGNSVQPTGEITLNLGDNIFSFGFIPLNFSGSSSLPRPITYNGTTYAINSAIQSELKADILDFSYGYYLLNMDDLPSRLQIAFETSVKTVNIKTNITSGGITSNKSATVPIPTIGLRGRVALADFIGLTGRIGYLGYSGNSFTDYDAQIEFSPIPTLGIYGGYRFLKIKVDASGILADATFKGPHAGVFFRF
ncbi:hypothetical protein D8Y20_01235 [Mariprofundus sp. EBB-1]|uniref:hypothetical protein n=1 Tax=Mariprofundus sp. EBB-1 TaxID=2650971 RepID=UPI000EF1C4FA|nr:hypothetical protein [Mariprofundus sp. EBB-1]RLL55558.1 hypothetical protein D8Y20_01235 [Mariprofundus sp. EBB-1]